MCGRGQRENRRKEKREKEGAAKGGVQSKASFFTAEPICDKT